MANGDGSVATATTFPNHNKKTHNKKCMRARKRNEKTWMKNQKKKKKTFKRKNK